MPLAIADLDDIRRELGPIVTEAVREHAADVTRLANEAVRARLADKTFLDTKAVAAYLGIAESTVRQYRNTGAFGRVYERFSRQYVRRDAVDAYLAGGGEPSPTGDRPPVAGAAPAKPAVSSPHASPETPEGTKSGSAA